MLDCLTVKHIRFSSLVGHLDGLNVFYKMTVTCITHISCCDVIIWRAVSV